MLRCVKKALIVGAHPDDLEMCAGGLIAKLLEVGVEVQTITLSRYSTLNGVRLGEACNAQKLLGVHSVLFAEGHDTRLYQNKHDLIIFVDAEVKKFKPDLVVTHFYADTHQDHATAYEVVAAAARTVPNMLMFKPTYPSGRTDAPFHPTMILQLSANQMQCKMDAMRQFKSQMSKYGDESWINALIANMTADAWTYGGHHGYAELFQVSRLLA